ncbi:hypothetical protein [Flavobacterium ginsenosidimutans]|uniref:hypothetical protein n=1 Tax=Flavobacterium ginsenosidimutans TaxID=687844 RepID=UPI0013A615F7|nr:hypothetical protein [Flavobacterium ginsenosidimutans]KAF2330444.1 hypothetical protein DM444_13935 [Flavobacterium ginsenosidimutans]
MKKAYLFLIPIIMLSCTKKSTSDLLLGDWKMKELIYNDNVSDKTTFTNDSVITEIDTEGRLIRITGTYKFNPKDSTLQETMRYENVNYKVISIDNDHLNLEDSRSKRIFKYIRY